MSLHSTGGRLATLEIQDHQVSPILDYLEAELRRSRVSQIERQQDGLRFRGLLYRPVLNPFRALASVGSATVRVHTSSTQGIEYSVSTIDYLLTSALIAGGPAYLAYRLGSGPVEVALTFAVPMILLSVATCTYAATRLGDYLREVLASARP